MSGRFVFGSDQEPAMVKAAEAVFPDGILLLCTRHLEENLDRRLGDRKIAPEKRKAIVDAVFKDGGLTSATSAQDFDDKKYCIMSDYSQELSTMTFEKTCRTLWSKVVEPTISHDFIPKKWTTNASESSNHKFKLETAWRSLPIPDLITVLHGVVITQEDDTKAALYGQGNFSLAPSVKQKFGINPACWNERNKEQQLVLLVKFGKGIKKKPNVVTSVNGALTLPVCAKTQKKINQMTRCRPNRTVTPMKKVQDGRVTKPKKTSKKSLKAAKAVQEEAFDSLSLFPMKTRSKRTPQRKDL
jgi:hypothetical protein